jgi:hypothetical protein
MYGGFDVFKVYLAVKLHFTSNYNYFDYDGKVNCKLETFTKRNDRYFFHKLSTKYDKNEILDFFVSNFCENDKKWIGNLLQNDGRETYLNYKKVKDNFNYHFRNDCINISNDFNSKRLNFNDGFLCSGGQHPRLLRLLIQRRASFQTIIVLNEVLSFIKNWNKQIEEKVVWPKIAHTITKLSPFIRYNMTDCKLVMKEIFLNV